MSRAHTIGRRPRLTLDTSVAPPRSRPYEIIAPIKFARTIANIRRVSDHDLEMLVRAFEKIAATSDELGSTFGALKKLLAGRAAAREKEESGLGLFGDAKPALSGKKVEKMVGEWMVGVENAWEEE
ncbi:hypothetical protein MBLNU13_g09720t1 [Cladosporium sp. NU13]